VVHLSYRGNRYKLKEGVIHFNIGDRPTSVKGMVNLNLEQAPALSQMTDDDITEHVIGLLLLNQHNLKKDLKLFGLPGEKAVTKELQQLHETETYIPMVPKKLSRIDRFKALSALMFLVEKRDGSIKARKCAVRSKQRTWEG